MDSNPAANIAVYRSRLHPDGRTRRGVFGVEMVRPLSMTMLPVMIGTLVAMLQGISVLSVLYIGFPVAALLAFGWTWIQLRTKVCEILVSDQKIAMRSVFSAAVPTEKHHWKLLIDMRRNGKGVTITVGLEEFNLEPEDWPMWQDLIGQLDEALHPSNAQGQGPERDMA